MPHQAWATTVGNSSAQIGDKIEVSVSKATKPKE